MTISSYSDPYRSVPDMSLGDFMSRPIQIGSYKWSQNTNFHQSFNPWQLFLEDKRVSNRINNYKMFSGKLHVKAVINGNSFFYGLMGLHYVPMYSLTVNTDRVSTPLFNAANNSSAYNVMASQFPKVFLNPTTSQGGTLTLPFIYDQNMCDLTDGSTTLLGSCNMRTYNLLDHANGATDQVGITIYAWMTDVKLAGLTLRNVSGLTPQGPTEQDDQAEGKYSKIATRIAGMSTAAAAISPVIAPYALATEAAASGAARMLRLFGYSRPIDDGGAKLIAQEPVGNLSNVNVGENAIKLSLDSRQEITVDPRTSGAGPEDHMDISSIVSREAYYTTFPWTISNANEDALFRCIVDPCIFRDVTNGGNNVINVGTSNDRANARILAPMGQIAQMFQYWKGDINFRFQVVASGFHKGRLRIVYDPCNSDGDTDYNVNYSKIIDISTESDITISVGCSQTKSWLRHIDPVSQLFSQSDCFQEGPAFVFPLSLEEVDYNGSLSVYVVNELTVPNSTTSHNVQINMYVSAGENFRVAAPRPLDGYYNFRPEGPEASVGDENKMGVIDDPVHEIVHTHLGLKPPDACPAERMYMGESVLSVNSLLKRYNHIRSAVSGSGNVLQITHGLYPLVPGDILNNPDVLVGLASGYQPGVGFTSASFTTFSVIAPCFLGASGSTRWKYLAAPFLDTDCNDMLICHRSPDHEIYTENTSTISFSLNSANYTSRLGESETLPGLTVGGHIVTTRQKPSLEVEIPFYRDIRFSKMRTLDYNALSSGNGNTVTLHSQSTSTNKRIHTFFATGDDFRFHLWMTTPFFIPGPRNPGFLYPTFL